MFAEPIFLDASLELPEASELQPAAEALLDALSNDRGPASVLDHLTRRDHYRRLVREAVFVRFARNTTDRQHQDARARSDAAWADVC